MYQALYRKYRPKSLSEVIGQNVIVNTLKNAIKNDRISHAYLFTGPRGTGKTSIAKAFAKTINCESLKNMEPCNNCVSCTQTNLKQNTDIIEIDAASNNGVDEIREIRNKVILAPAYGKYKVYIIDEVHMLTIGAFNALLKTLEEPPQHVIFILATTEPHKIPVTILSRCQRFDIKRISKEDIVNRLKYICEKENILINNEVLYEIASISDGGMRDSISLLDQVVSYVDKDKNIELEDLHEVSGTLDDLSIKKFVEFLLNCNLSEILKLLQIYEDNGVNIKKFTEKIMCFFEKIIISKEIPNYIKESSENVDLYINLPKYDNNLLLNCIEILNNQLPKISNSTNSKLLLELSLIKIINLLKENCCKSKNELYNDINSENDIVYKEHKRENNINSNNKTIEVKKENEINLLVKDETLLKKMKFQRINNILSKLDKKQIQNIKNNIEVLKNHMMNPKYGYLISMIIDAQIKATSDEGVILVFEEQSMSNNFNENIPIIEEIFSKLAFCEKKVVSVSTLEWNEIKNEFNSKQKKYIYDLNEISENDIFKKNDENINEISEMFNDCIEYV